MAKAASLSGISGAPGGSESLGICLLHLRGQEHPVDGSALTASRAPVAKTMDGQSGGRPVDLPGASPVSRADRDGTGPLAGGSAAATAGASMISGAIPRSVGLDPLQGGRGRIGLPAPPRGTGDSPAGAVRWLIRDQSFKHIGERRPEAADAGFVGDGSLPEGGGADGTMSGNTGGGAVLPGGANALRCGRTGENAVRDSGSSAGSRIMANGRCAAERAELPAMIMTRAGDRGNAAQVPGRGSGTLVLGMPRPGCRRAIWPSTEEPASYLERPGSPARKAPTSSRARSRSPASKTSEDRKDFSRWSNP